ncbi:formate-dependent uric acid utilization protein AegA [Shewanella fodinae]|jgi:glutamate synthase small subunit-like protein|uniref:formate-dependent uric acid utilization protein AegA n=1 Tax=Shewanella fodinae TaxID=552357 RepID=UPI00167497DA|nr:formate-dependent uric acid utilization protein AegA [Shewanella fodinae]MCL2908186.1 formate-dependent uric acid utilization protein AegA [Shewanella fodinae]GGZ14240.1 oxidoreductase FeS-binding subunit [Shewanella fodinae]
MNQFVIANGNDCIGCRACEIACVLSHNGGRYPDSAEAFHPRIKVVRGASRISAAVCRHCEDAPCANACPVRALSRQDGSIQLQQDKCIGCKSCVLACPFGAINMVYEETNGTEVKAYAHKCDLCHDSEQGPACVQACPTKALRLLDDQALVALRRQKQLRSAGVAYDLGSPHIHRLTPILASLPQRPRQEALKTPLALRKTTFVETYQPFSTKQVEDQADRCLSCSDRSVCEWTCPLHNNIPRLLELAKQGRINEAVELSHKTSSLPEVCGRVCPQDRLCEGSCTLKDKYGAVTIGNVERYITDTALANGWKPNLQHVKATGKRVAVIGAGPAGLGCADILSRNGIKAVVFDRHPEIGGMLTFGIPAFKLDKQVLINRHQLFADMGIEFRLETEVGRDISLQQLLDEFDAVFVGTGTYQSMQAGLEHEDAPGVYEALPFLIANTKHEMGLPALVDEPYINLAGKRVVVLGGGDTAMDCLRTSLRQGAAVVTCAYRRDEANMPGSKKEVKNAREEGAEFLFNVQPQFIQLDAQGHFAGIGLIRTELGEPDSSGRRRPQVVAGSEFVLEADALIIAFGFSAHSMPWLEAAKVKCNRWGLIEAPRNSRFPCQTSHPQIFAGGDIVRGADLVVTAMSDGRKAALGIIASLGLELQSAPPIQ